MLSNVHAQELQALCAQPEDIYSSPVSTPTWPLQACEAEAPVCNLHPRKAICSSGRSLSIHGAAKHTSLNVDRPQYSHTRKSHLFQHHTLHGSSCNRSNATAAGPNQHQHPQHCCCAPASNSCTPYQLKTPLNHTALQRKSSVLLWLCTPCQGPEAPVVVRAPVVSKQGLAACARAVGRV